MAAGLALLVVVAAPGFTQAPSDLLVIAQGGGLAPDQPIAIAIIDSTGTGTFCRILPQDRLTLFCTEQIPLALSQADLDSIWSAVQGNGFFGLAPSYLDTTYVGGTWADLVVTGGGQANVVHSQNTAVPGLDNVMIAINAVLPPTHQITYNEIVP